MARCCLQHCLLCLLLDELLLLLHQQQTLLKLLSTCRHKQQQQVVFSSSFGKQARCCLLVSFCSFFISSKRFSSSSAPAGTAASDSVYQVLSPLGSTEGTLTPGLLCTVMSTRCVCDSPGTRELLHQQDPQHMQPHTAQQTHICGLKNSYPRSCLGCAARRIFKHPLCVHHGSTNNLRATQLVSGTPPLAVHPR